MENQTTIEAERERIADYLSRLDILRYGSLARGDLAKLVQRVRTGDLDEDFSTRPDRGAFSHSCCVSSPLEVDRLNLRNLRLQEEIDSLRAQLERTRG